MYSSKYHHKKKPHTQPKSNTKRLTEEQVRLLEASFKVERRLDTDRKFYLAQELGIPARQVAIWYQNKRARWKSQSLEMGYTTLEQKLDNALLENLRLEKEVKRLRQDLDKLRQMFVASNNSSSSSTSFACDLEGSSNFMIGDPNSFTFQTELYACLLGRSEGHL